MRFEVSRVLDAIEQRLTVDPAVARAVIDLGEVLRYTDLDAGRPASLLRLGQVVDALARQTGEDGVAVYVVADRGVLADGDLTSNERMVIRRWADDGLIDVLPSAGDRVFEVADMAGLPVLSRRDPGPFVTSFPWLRGDPGRLVAPVAGAGGTVLHTPHGLAAPMPLTHPVLSRRWQCPEPGCALFGPHRTAGAPPARLRAGRPTCPRHEHPLADGGPRPPSVTFAVRVGGVVRQRFAVTAGQPVTIGREPAEPTGVRLGPWLAGEALLQVSRSHVVLALTPGGVEVVDISTNGTMIRGATGETPLGRDGRHLLGESEVVELHSGVEVGRAGLWRTGAPSQTRSVMAEAPTIALRLP